MTLDARTFFGVATAALRVRGCRLTTFLAGLRALVAFFFAGAKVFFVEDFFAADRAAAFCAFRTGGLEATLRVGLAFKVRPLTDDLVAGRRAVVREVDRLPFVMGLLICGGSFQFEGR